MDRLRHRVPLLVAFLHGLMLCTCALCARAEFEAADSANLAAINQAVAAYLQGIDQKVKQQTDILSLHLPELSTIKSEMQTLRMAMGEAVPAILAESRLHTTQLRSIASSSDDAAYSLYGIETSLDDLADLMVNQPYRLNQILTGVGDIGDDMGTAVVSLEGIDDGIESVDGSIDDLSEGLSGQNAYVDDWGELEEFAPADIDESVSPYDDGQTIHDRGSSQFKMSFKSFLNEIYNQLSLNEFWTIEDVQQTFQGYILSAPTSISLSPSTQIMGFTVPSLVIDWAPLKTSQVLLSLKVFIKAILVGMFGFEIFHRVSAVI